jgi:myosin heavy subunit
VTAKEAGLELAKATLDSRELELREQRAKLTTVTTELEARQREGEQRQCEIAARTAELKKTKAELDSRDIALRDQQAELSAVAGELETRQREVERFAAEYETVRQEIESRRLELQTLESTIAEERSRLEDEQLCVNERSEELERKSQELCARESELSSREATILQRRADLESNQTELESQRKEIESKEDQLAAYEKSLRKREEGLSERERDIHQRSEIVTRFKQFVEEANEAYDITVNSPVEPAPEASRDVPESDDTYLRQSPTDQTVVLDRIRRERRFAVAELEEETRQLAAGLPDAEHVDEESPSDEPTTGIDLQTLEPDVRDRLRALRRIGDNGKSDSELIMQIRTELQHEGSGRAHKRPNKKSWWRA